MTTLPPAAHGTPLNGAELLDEAYAVFRKYTVQQSEHAYTALAAYVAYTHAADCFDFAPRLVLTSPEKRSGKTRTLELVSLLAAEAVMTANASTAAVYRLIGEKKERGEKAPAILIDEADTIFGTKVKAEQNEDLRGLLNAGFQRNGKTLRYDVNQQSVVEIDTFAPAVLAAIGKLPDTITDRAVNIRLRRRKPTEKVHDFRSRRDSPYLHGLAGRLTAWADDNADTLKNAMPDSPLRDRAADLWEPLIAIADTAGGSWPQRVRDAAVYLVREAEEGDSESSEGLELLRDIRSALELLTSDFVPSTNLLRLLKNLEESRWVEVGLSTRRLSDLLRPYGIRPRQVTRRQSTRLPNNRIQGHIRALPSRDPAPAVTTVRTVRH